MTMKQDRRLRPVAVPLIDAVLEALDQRELDALLAPFTSSSGRRDDPEGLLPTVSAATLHELHLLAAFESADGTVGFGASGAAPEEFVASVRRSAVQEHGIELDLVRSLLALASALQRVLYHPAAKASGILFTGSAPVRSPILPEVIQHGAVRWYSPDYACLAARIGGREYDFHFVEIELPGSAQHWIIMDRRMHRMKELVEGGMDRSPAARQAIHEMPARRHQLENSLVRALLREWSRRGWPTPGTRTRKPSSVRGRRAD